MQCIVVRSGSIHFRLCDGADLPSSDSETGIYHCYVCHPDGRKSERVGGYVCENTGLGGISSGRLHGADGG